jgi:hypothetical protein
VAAAFQAEYEGSIPFTLIAQVRAAAAAIAADLSEVAANRLCRRCGDTCTISFLRPSSSLRFCVVREGQYRARSPLSEPLVKTPIETFDQFVDDIEPASPLYILWTGAIVDDRAFNKLVSARELESNLSIAVAKCVPCRICYKLIQNHSQSPTPF